jgi:hypothetical protein
VGTGLPADLRDTDSKVAFSKLYDTKIPLTAADLRNDRVVPFFEAHEIPLLRILTDRGTEYCGAAAADHLALTRRAPRRTSTPSLRHTTRLPTPGVLVHGKTPMRPFIESVPLAREKVLVA